jgi:hypothetical protein
MVQRKKRSMGVLHFSPFDLLHCVGEHEIVPALHFSLFDLRHCVGVHEIVPGRISDCAVDHGQVVNKMNQIEQTVVIVRRKHTSTLVRNRRLERSPPTPPFLPTEPGGIASSGSAQPQGRAGPHLFLVILPSSNENVMAHPHITAQMKAVVRKHLPPSSHHLGAVLEQFARWCECGGAVVVLPYPPPTS